MQGKTISQAEADKMVEKYRMDVQRCVYPGFQNAEQAVMESAGLGAGEKIARAAGEAPGGPYLTGTSSARRYTRSDMHEKAAASEQLSANRNHSAAAFLRSHPEFETFLDLIKDGAITLY